jgi:hypothetical protein
MVGQHVHMPNMNDDVRLLALKASAASGVEHATMPAVLEIQMYAMVWTVLG